MSFEHHEIKKLSHPITEDDFATPEVAGNTLNNGKSTELEKEIKILASEVSLLSSRQIIELMSDELFWQYSFERMTEQDANQFNSTTRLTLRKLVLKIQDDAKLEEAFPRKLLYIFLGKQPSKVLDKFPMTSCTVENFTEVPCYISSKLNITHKLSLFSSFIDLSLDNDIVIKNIYNFIVQGLQRGLIKIVFDHAEKVYGSLEAYAVPNNDFYLIRLFNNPKLTAALLEESIHTLGYFVKNNYANFYSDKEEQQLFHQSLRQDIFLQKSMIDKNDLFAKITKEMSTALDAYPTQNRDREFVPKLIRLYRLPEYKAAIEQLYPNTLQFLKPIFQEAVEKVKEIKILKLNENLNDQCKPKLMPNTFSNVCYGFISQSERSVMFDNEDDIHHKKLFGDDELNSITDDALYDNARENFDEINKLSLDSSIAKDVKSALNDVLIKFNLPKQKHFFNQNYIYGSNVSDIKKILKAIELIAHSKSKWVQAIHKEFSHIATTSNYKLIVVSGIKNFHHQNKFWLVPAMTFFKKDQPTVSKFTVIAADFDIEQLAVALQNEQNHIVREWGGPLQKNWDVTQANQAVALDLHFLNSKAIHKPCIRILHREATNSEQRAVINKEEVHILCQRIKTSLIKVDIKYSLGFCRTVNNNADYEQIELDFSNVIHRHLITLIQENDAYPALKNSSNFSKPVQWLKNSFANNWNKDEEESYLLSIGKHFKWQQALQQVISSFQGDTFEFISDRNYPFLVAHESLSCLSLMHTSKMDALEEFSATMMELEFQFPGRAQFFTPRTWSLYLKHLDPRKVLGLKNIKPQTAWDYVKNSLLLEELFCEIPKNIIVSNDGSELLKLILEVNRNCHFVQRSTLRDAFIKDWEGYKTIMQNVRSVLYNPEGLSAEAIARIFHYTNFNYDITSSILGKLPIYDVNKTYRSQQTPNIDYAKYMKLVSTPITDVKLRLTRETNQRFANSLFSGAYSQLLMSSPVTFEAIHNYFPQAQISLANQLPNTQTEVLNQWRPMNSFCLESLKSLAPNIYNTINRIGYENYVTYLYNSTAVGTERQKFLTLASLPQVNFPIWKAGLVASCFSGNIIPPQVESTPNFGAPHNNVLVSRPNVFNQKTNWEGIVRFPNYERTTYGLPYRQVNITGKVNYMILSNGEKIRLNELIPKITDAPAPLKILVKTPEFKQTALGLLGVGLTGWSTWSYYQNARALRPDISGVTHCSDALGVTLLNWNLSQAIVRASGSPWVLLPLTTLSLIGALPDQKEKFDRAWEKIDKQDQVELPETEQERLNNIIYYGNPWGPTWGIKKEALIKMGPKQCMALDPENLEFYGIQKIGQGLNRILALPAQFIFDMRSMLNPDPKIKINEVAAEITSTPQDEAAARAIDSGLQSLSNYRMMVVPGASCPVIWNQRKNNQPEVMPPASPPSAGTDLDNFFNLFNPVPLDLPVKLETPAAPWEPKQNYFKEPIPKPPIISQDLGKSPPGVFNVKQNTTAPKEIIRQPFDIRHARPIATQRGAGLSVSLGATGNLSVLVSKYGEGILELTVVFDAQFWPTLFTGIGIGALIAGAAMTVQFFINRHLKHLQEKINRTLKHSRKEQAQINSLISGLKNKFNSMESKNSKDCENLLHEIEIAIQKLQGKIQRELDRAEKVHEWQGKAAKPHNLLAIDYQDRLSGLQEMKDRLQLDHIRVKFVEDNEKKSSDELIILGKQLTNQPAFTKEDTARLEGLKQLISSEIIKYVAQGELENATALDLESNSINYYAPGNLNELKFDILLGVVDGKTGKILGEINQKISEINIAIGKGENPVTLINALVKYIESDVNVVNNFLHRCNNRRHAHANASVNYVSKAQWQGRIEDVNKFVDYLKEKAKDYKDGNVPVSLSSNPLSKSLRYLQQHQSEFINFWFEELERNKVNENREQTEEQLILYVGSIASIKKGANNAAEHGFYREAGEILQKLKIKTKEDVEEDINRMVFRHEGQIVNTLAKPFQDIAGRFVQGLAPSRQKAVAEWVFAILNTLQIAVPNALSLVMQAVHAEASGNQVTFRAELKDIRKQVFEDISSLRKGWMLKQQLFFKAANYITESWMPERYQLQSRNFLAKGNALSRFASVGNTGYQVWKLGFNANIAQQGLSLIQPVYEISMSKYHGSLATRGYDIEDPHFYKLESTAMPILQGLAGTLHMAFIHRGANRWTLAAGLAGILYALYYYNSKATDNEANEKVLSAAVNNIRSNSHRKEMLQYYEKKCGYKIILDEAKEHDLEKVRSGERVLFVSESSTLPTLADFWIYLQGEKNNSIQKKPLSAIDSKVVQDLYLSLCKGITPQPCVVETDSDRLKQLAMTYIKDMISADEIKSRIAASCNKIEEVLKTKFNGLRYNKDQSSSINEARLIHFYCKIKDLFEQKEHAVLIAATNIIKENGELTIGNDYHLPPYFAWEVIVHFRLATFATVSEYLQQFRSEFDEYSKFIDENAPIIWRQLNEKRMRDGLKNIVQYAMQQFIDAASKAATKEDKLKYLSFVSINYFYPLEQWYETLDSDELKFWAAYEYNIIGDKEQSKLFLAHIKDIFKLLKSKCKNETFVNYLVDLLKQIDDHKYKKLLTLSSDHGIHDNLIKKELNSIISQEKYKECLSLLNEVRDFKGKQFYLALATFEESKQTAVLETLKYLCAEKPKNNLEYWVLCFRVLNKCLSSIAYGPNEIKRLSAAIQLTSLVITCAKYIQKFEISYELRQEISEIANNALIYLSANINNDNEITKLLDDAHECLSGEKQLNMFSSIEKILLSLSYELNDNGVHKKFLPLDTPPDGDCLFHVLGISRHKGITLLRNSVAQPNYFMRQFSGNKQRQDVINILLDDLEIKNNTRYDRGLQSQEANIKLILNYLDELYKPKVWMPYNQRGRSVLDALALLLNKNLCIFVATEEGGLVFAGGMVHDEQFETIDMLHTNAEGFSSRQEEFNHYIRLKYMPVQCEEITDALSAQVNDNRPRA